MLEIIPFGDTSLFVTDLRNQYVPYFSYFRDSLSSGESLFYSFSKTMGGEMVGLTAYYLLSPFNILFLFFEQSNFPLVLSLITLLKTGAAGLTMFLYLSKGTKTITYINTLFSTAYALCSYMVTYYQNIIWLDSLIFLPLIIWGIDNLFKRKHMYIYPLFLGIALIVNYYIAYMICIFSVLYFIASLLEKWINKQDKFSWYTMLKTLGRFVVGSLVAGGLAAFILIPTFLSVQGGDDFQFVLSDLLNTNLNFSLSQFISKFLIGSNSEGMQSGLPLVFSSSLSLLLGLHFIVNKRVQLGTKVKYVFLLVVLFFSFNIVGLNLIWHAFNAPTWFPYRYSFLFPFVLITMAAKDFHTNDYSKNRFIGVTSLVLLGILFIGTKDYSNINYQRVFITLLIVAFWGALSWLWMRYKQTKAFLLLGVILMSGELVANSFMISNEIGYWLSAESYSNYVEKHSPIIDEYTPGNDEFYRMEKTYHYTENDPLLFGFPGLSHYSSSEKGSVKDFLGNLGYRNYGKWARYSYGSSMLSDSLMGIRYVLTQTPQQQYEYVGEHQDVMVYENPYSFSLGFLTESRNLSEPIEASHTFEYQNELYNSLLGTQNPLKEISDDRINKELENVEQVTDSGNEFHYSKNNTNEDAYIHYEIDNVSDQVINMYFPTSSTSGVEIYADGDYVANDLETKNHNVNVAVSDGDTITISLKLNNNEIHYENELFYEHTMQDMETIDQEMESREINITDMSSTHIEADLPSETANRNLVMTIPYNEGWNVKVDGQSVETFPVHGVLMGIQIPENSQNIEMNFSATGMNIGIMISVISGLAIVVFIWKEKKD